MSNFDPKQFFELAAKVGHGQALGLEYRASGDDWVELALPWREELVGVAETGILASGAIVSLVDTCGGASIWQALGQFQHIVTIDLRLDYLRPALKGETVIARCRCDKLTRQIAFVSGMAHTGDDGRPVARAVGTFMLTP
ncbi:PaaI family thioesterase [Sphingomonas sp.]|uniref:PaaI family thioesterase n=1 Tax=Sphingomonas sp. TaxID=28214 RepID=UPI00286AD28D|nr:PaaI family thioesterase [Sphingomonas sp.]